MTTIQNFTDLIVYQKAHVLVLKVYKTTSVFPKEEIFGITSQMRRSAISITSNIAEGFGRNHARDKQQFYAIAKGSVLELQSQILISCDLKFIKQELSKELNENILEITKLLAGIIRSADSR